MHYRERYCAEYLDKIFYYCLRKTSNEQEAADLSSDISIQILQALHNNVLPEHFSAWVWKIARNRYARWADRKHRRAVNEHAKSISGWTEWPTLDPPILEHLIVQEEIGYLRRELAFIRSDYRKLLVAFYIDGRKIKDIASELQLPENTVKTKLFQSRKKLKEGMAMAREFGKLSYNPENIIFGYSVYTEGELGEPYSLVRRAIPKNILIETYRNPSTAEQLSLELGIALPYIENEIEELLQGTLLTKNGNLYESNVIILSKEFQTDNYTKFLAKKSAYATVVKNIIEAKSQYFHSKMAPLMQTTQSAEDRKWALVALEFERILMKLFTLRHGSGGMTDYDHLESFLTRRPNGGVWEIMGAETGCPLMPGVDIWYGNNAIDEGGTTFVFNITLSDYRKEPLVELNHHEDAALNQVILGRADTCSQELLGRLEQLGYIDNVDGVYQPCCLDIRKELWFDEAEASNEVVQSYQHALQLYGEYYDDCTFRVEKEISQAANKYNTLFPIQSFMYDVCAYVIEELLEQGYLQYSNDRMVGVYHYVKD